MSLRVLLDVCGILDAYLLSFKISNMSSFRLLKCLWREIIALS